jgi:glycerol uptake facilitator-like aquaporin
MPIAGSVEGGLRNRSTSVDSPSPLESFRGGLVPGFNHLDGFNTQVRDQPHGRSAMKAFLGFHQLRSRTLLGEAVTELNFTAIFMFFHIGIVRAATMKDTFSAPAVVGGLGHFLLIVLCTFAGAGSGAHFNPNITVATTLIGLTTVYRCLVYMAFQLCGAMLGVLLMRIVLGWDVTPTDLAVCSRGSLSFGSAVCVEAFFFHALLCVIGGISFDHRQMRIFGPVLAPIFIASAIGLIVFTSLNIGQPGYGPMLNWAQCVGTSIVVGEFNGDELISFLGPTIASLVHSALFIAVPPSHAQTGRWRLPLIESQVPSIRVHSDHPFEGEGSRRLSLDIEAPSSINGGSHRRM